MRALLSDLLEQLERKIARYVNRNSKAGDQCNWCPHKIITGCRACGDGK